MLDIGGLELLLIAVVALLVIGPERMPEALRTLGLWLGRLRRSLTSVKNEIEKEIGMDEVRRQLHNESVMAELEDAKTQVESAAKNTEQSVNKIVNSASFDPGASTFTDEQVQASNAESEAVQEKSFTEELASEIEEVGFSAFAAPPQYQVGG